MSKNFDMYEYVDFHAYAMGKKMKKKIGSTEIALVHHSRTEDIRSQIQHEQAEVLCLLKGKLHDGDGKLLLSPGDATTFAELRRVSRLEAFSDILYFAISYAKKH
jgi:hypothetical protein